MYQIWFGKSLGSVLENKHFGKQVYLYTNITFVLSQCKLYSTESQNQFYSLKLYTSAQLYFSPFREAAKYILSLAAFGREVRTPLVLPQSPHNPPYLGQSVVDPR